MKSFEPKDLSVPKLHGYLLSSVSPRPIAWVSTIDKDGNPNLAPFSFFNIFSANPPIAIFSPARRVRDNTTKHTLENVKVIKEAVINVVNYSLVQQCSLSSTEYPQGVNEFEKAGLESIESDLIRPLRIANSPVQLECIVKDIIELGNEGGAGNLVVCEIIKIHIAEEILDENGSIDTHKIDLVARCGGNWYSRANESSLFEVEKPIRNLGIGIDVIPDDIRYSKILTGNDLGILGNVESLPDETEVNEFKLTTLAELFIDFEDNKSKLEKELHKFAKDLLEKGEVVDAWMTLLAFNNG